MKSDSQMESKNVVDLTHFRKRREFETTVAQGRTPLVVSHLEGRVKNDKNGQEDPDFGDRILKIRSSLEKINGLMSELRRMANKQDQGRPTPTIDRRKTPQSPRD